MRAICTSVPPRVLWLAVGGWALWAANSRGMGADATRVTYTGIVDERRFYAQATGHAHPLTAADYLDYPRMRAVVTAIENTPDGALLLPAGDYDMWDVVPALPPPPDAPPGYIGPHTVFFTNLGMLGMNVGLDVRVIDQIGLANPLAAHTARLEDGRIGHDKNLFPDWAVAEGPFLKKKPFIPTYLDEDWIRQAEAALKCPDTEAVLTGDPGSDGAETVPVEPGERDEVHRLPHRPGPAVRARALRTSCAGTGESAIHRAAPDRALVPVVVADHFEHHAERVEPEHREVGRRILRKRLRRMDDLAAEAPDKLMDVADRRPGLDHERKMLQPDPVP